jgi:type IV pilus assembly protein PilM
MAFDLSSIFKKGITSNNDPSCIGVDIGASAIKIVQLKSQRGVPTLETYGELQLGPYEGSDVGRETNLPQNKIVQALIDILRESGATGKRAAYALSYNSSFTKVIRLQTLDQSQIGIMLPIEARKYIPTSLSKVTLDWVALGEDKEKRETEVLLSAVYNESASRYESIMRDAQLNVTDSEIELFSSIRSVVSPEDKTVAVIDFGASSTRLYIVRNGFIHKTHSVTPSGVEITRSLASGLKVSFLEAEETKRTYGLIGNPDNPEIQKALTKSLERGIRELHTVIVRYEQEYSEHIEKVIVTGGGALLKGLPAYLQSIFSHPVVYANPFDKIQYQAFLEDTLKEAGPSFAVSIGIALRGFQNIK